LVGCFLAFSICQILNKIPSVRLVLFAGLSMPPSVLLISLGVAFAVGFLSSVFPAWNASRIPITEALRHAG
jgi:ABC-type antimicrobial peptide transport system permease subunit